MTDGSWRASVKTQPSALSEASSPPVKFSVIIPYYKDRLTIRRALESVLSQSYQPHEVFVVDDDSRDNLLGEVDDYNLQFAKKGSLLRIFTNPRNGGPSVARNTGWNFATGDFIAFLDADDEWHPQKLQICVDLLAQRRPAGAFHGSWVPPDADAALRFASGLRRSQDFSLKRVPRYKWLIRNQAATPSVIVDRRISERFDPTLRYCEDHELWLRIAFRHGGLVEIVGPSLTQLGRATMTAGGQSSWIHQMRLGEMRMYTNFCGKRPLLFLFLPLLWGWSIMKHCYFLLRRIQAAF